MRIRKKKVIIYHFSLFYLWVILSLISLISLILILNQTLINGNFSQRLLFFQNQGKTSHHYLLYSELVSIPTQKTIYQTEIETRDARVLVIHDYLQRYDSPMLADNKEIASIFVQAADEYNIPWTLLPAIAQCESNLGKHVPPHCYNAWGYGIHSKGTLCFSSWTEGIKRVARGLSQDYLSQGLVKPETIMAKYTPVSNGSWARCVDHFTQELLAGIN